ncbi:protein KIAA0100 isoform X3 [Zootermopsis nevadensis]|uniref:protein KIAA0100 isoform X3 n=1 Tax=Zootermopsis nevadensis TaxID=136037 RepID=UPI000B8E4C22|nr:protein KIAA0100 isoform X3 [Zootermopsis nevadensis]
MNGFATFCLLCILLYCSVSWLLPKLLAWLLKRKFFVEVQIGRIAVPYLTLKDVHISKSGFSVHVDEIGFRSSFFSSEVTKLLAVVVRDVRINKDVGAVDGKAENLQHSSGLEDRRPVNFYNKKVPPVIITFAQFMAIHVYNVNTMFLRAESPEWLVHATAGEVHLDGSIVHNARTLLVNVTVAAATAKMLRHAQKGDDSAQTCLGELSFGISMEAVLIAQGPLSVEKLYVGMDHTKAVINEGFYNFAQERRQTSEVDRSPGKSLVYSAEADIFQRIFPIIPKNFNFRIEDSVLTGMRDSHTDFSATLQCFQIDTHFCPPSTGVVETKVVDMLPQIFLAVEVQVDELSVKCNKETILLLRKLAFDSKLQDAVLNTYIRLDTLTVTYSHKDIYSWVLTSFPNIYNAQEMEDEVVLLRRETAGPARTWLDSVVSQCQIKGLVELWAVSALIRLSEDAHCASVGFSHSDTKFMLEKHSDAREYGYKWPFLGLLLGGCRWSTELRVESLWCNLGKFSQGYDTHVLKKYHTWGTPLFLGVFLVKLSSQGTAQLKFSSVLDTVRFEWSPPFGQFITQGFRCIHEYKDAIRRSRSYQKGVSATIEAATSSKMDVVKCFESCIINVTSRNVNVFFIADKRVCVMVRVDSASIENMTSNTVMALEGAKLSSICPTKTQYTCLRSEEVKPFVGHTKLARVTYVHKKSDLRVQLLDEVQAQWSTNLHLKLLTLIQEVGEFISGIKALSALSGEFNVHKSRIHNPMHKSLNLQVKGQVRFGITISSRHCMDFTSDYIIGTMNRENLAIQAMSVRIAIDNKEIFSIDDFQVAKILDSEEVRLERKNTEGFILPWNITWNLTISSLKACFPYEHNFSEAIQNELVSVVKWLKLVHKKQRQPFTSDSPLPPDLLIKVKEFLFEMSDDPFEVRLRDNYELLEDEYKESLKRQKMLDVKVAELCKAHLLLPAGKVEELYASLSKRNTEIYVQRSRQMCRAAPARTRLFAWLMNDVEILTLADLSVHGAENVMNTMTEIDPDSPWPEEGLEFTTLWCRSVCASCKEWKFQLRDFPQPLLDIKDLHIWGRLVGAEQEATRRAKRGVVIELGEPWGDATVERSMTSLKFYHDLNCEVEHYSYAFGPCWEPVIAQCNLSFEKILTPSQDPSPPLPFWDKMRLLFHGRLTMWVRQMTVLLHASLDPYNTTEEMELTWSEVAMDWTNAKVVFKGELNVYVRTASKYDDCRLLHLPNLKLTIKLNWMCLGDPNDHHIVMPCAPDKLPEYSSNQEHDSFRSFRSQNLNVSIALETKSVGNRTPAEFDCPVVLLYGSTLRWFENLKLILSGVTRPTRRGAVFQNLRPRKIQLSRHYRKAHLLLGLHKFQVYYWMSFAMQRGFELLGGRISSCSEHILTLVPMEGGLKHRPRAEWSIMYMNCELNDAEIWLKSALQEEPGKEHMSLRQPVEKCYCLSVAKVSYGRATILPNRGDLLNTSECASSCQDMPTHRLVVYDLKGAWTKSNRDVAFALFDTFVKTKQLKKNLSTEALKGFRGETSSTPLKSRTRASEGPVAPSPSNSIQNPATVQATPSPMTKLQSGHAATMLQQLIAEADNKAVVFSDDLSVQTRDQHLQGLAACQEDDVQHKNWLIALVNSQVLLKGCETKGYVILSAAKAEILQRVHRPAWKDRTLVSKTSWVGSLECMQYYATVSAGESDSLDENIMWLSVENIQEKDSTVIADVPDLPHLVGSGQSVGGVVSETVGASSNIGENPPIQLQRIVSRCKCEFFYAGYGESSIDPSTVDEVPPPPIDEGGPWEKRERAVDAFTLMHHDLDVCTNSLQYAMILDIVNNLLLYVEPRRKEAFERLQRMRFQLQLHSVEDQRRPIQQMQNQVRSLVSKLRRLEKKTHLIQRALAEDPVNEELMIEMDDLERQVFECKELLNSQSEELDMMLSCYKETQLSANQKLATMRGDKPVTTVRANEICFKHAQWRLTEADGQLGIADLVLSNFLYTKNSKSDDSGEHLLELGYVRMMNLLPNQVYKEVLSPTEIQSNMPVDRKRAVRVFCREKAPVGGISVKEHFEINVVPLTIGLTKKFFNTMLKFCFPERDPETIDGDGSDDIDADSKGKKLKGTKKSKETNFYVPIEQKDDVEKMKIPEVPVRVSYKGNKEKNLEDIRDFSLVIPTLEYHNVTWTWLDLLLAMKSDSRHVILSQAIKQKLQIKMNRGSADEGASPQEEDKARMLFGSRLMAGETKTLKKGMFKFSSK